MSRGKSLSEHSEYSHINCPKREAFGLAASAGMTLKRLTFSILLLASFRQKSTTQLHIFDTNKVSISIKSERASAHNDVYVTHSNSIAICVCEPYIRHSECVLVRFCLCAYDVVAAAAAH